MAGNPKAISVRINAANYHQARGQRKHDLRLGRVPKYVNRERISQNSILIQNCQEGELKRLCETRRKVKQRAMKRTAAVASRGIITFGKKARHEFDKVSVEKQNMVFESVARAIADHLKSDLVGLSVHRDEDCIARTFFAASLA